MALLTNQSLIQGSVAYGFEAVEAEFRRNFAERGEVGAACAVWHRGELVVDLWGGYRDPQRELTWEEDTLAGVFSTTKGMAAMTLAVAHSRGWLDYDEAVAHYWPEFAQAGKETTTVRQLLAHQAGLAAIDEALDLETIADPQRLALVLARQKPAWLPGHRHGYHPLSIGWYEAELLRRVDPRGRGLGRFFQEEIAGPLGIQFHIGLPDELAEQVAVIQDFAPMDLLRHLDAMPWKFVTALLNPWSLTSRAFRNPPFRRPGDMFAAPWRAVEIPAANGIGQARGIAQLYGELARGGGALGIHADTFAELCRPATAPAGGSLDLVARVNTAYSLGFLKPFPEFDFASDERAFGAPGMGGSIGFADPGAELGFAYIPSKTGFHFWNDPRELALRHAVYASLDHVSQGLAFRASR